MRRMRGSRLQTPEQDISRFWENVTGANPPQVVTIALCKRLAAERQKLPVTY